MKLARFRKKQAPPAPAGHLSSSSLLWLLGSLCQLHQVPFDPLLVERQFPPPCSLASIHNALHEFGFKTGERPLPATEAGLSKLQMPVAGFLPLPVQATPEGTEPRETATEPNLTPILIIKIDQGGIHYFRPGSQNIETANLEEAKGQLHPSLFFISRTEQAKGSSEADGIDGKPPAQKFGFRWFIPELLKHKTIWRDVLIASLIIQLIGLATPLFTQVVIDKVVVHQTQSTLIVIGVGMIMFMLFSSVMTWLRQYLVLHTGNRIDAVLGTQVFRHLLRIPLPYFEHRPTGVLVRSEEHTSDIPSRINISYAVFCLKTKKR